MPDKAAAIADVTYLDAVGQALMAEMEADESVFLIGEDVGQFGGAFKVTKGFLEKFGPRRVVDTPIAETGFTGLAAGAALVGLRPIVEYQFADFISCAFDPIINVMARHYYRTGDPIPVTMRAPNPGGAFRLGVVGSLSATSSASARAVRIHGVRADPRKARPVDVRLSQPARAAQLTAAGAVMPRSPAMTPIRTDRRSVVVIC